jgi:sulfite oxidase
MIFQQHIRAVPRITPNDWVLSIDGYVERPLTLQLATMLQRPHITRPSVLICSAHSAENPMLAEAEWGGVPFQAIVDYVQPQAEFVNFHSSDGYATSLPLAALQDALLAVTLNGQPLPPEHGYPVRLIVPGRAGYKQPKWIQNIVFAREPVSGFWERHGASADGAAPPAVTLDAITPQRVRVGESVRLAGHVYIPHAHQMSALSIRVGQSSHSNVPLEARPSGLYRWQTTWFAQVPGLYPVQLRMLEADYAEVLVDVRYPQAVIQVSA